MVSSKITYAENLLPLAGMLKSTEPQEMLLILNALFEKLVVEGLDAPFEEIQTAYPLLHAAQ
jgi:hypothetical protein